MEVYPAAARASLIRGAKGGAPRATPLDDTARHAALVAGALAVSLVALRISEGGETGQS